jgi:uncharacterized RDD family membrane protein YckC
MSDFPSPVLPSLPPAAPKPLPPPPVDASERQLAASRSIAAYHEYEALQPTLSGWPTGVRPVSGWGRLGCALLEGLLMTVTLGIGWIIWASIVVGGGQTPAKRLLNYRVIGQDTRRPVGFGRMFFIRYLVAGFVAQFAILFTLGILLFMPFWDSNRQNIWDKISSTSVMHDPHNAWNL